MKRFDEEQDLTVEDLKDIIFYRAREEMKAYLRAREKGYSDYDAENQRLRYIAVWTVISDAGLEEEYQYWKFHQ